MSQPSGYEVWRGKSRIDGAPIVVLMNPRSANTGTGDVAQTYILRSDIHPWEAVKTGEDVSICGNCPLKGVAGKGRACYVTIPHGPAQVWNSWRNGKYPKVTDDDLSYHLRRRMIRLGTYGDPAAVPMKVWNRLLSFAESHAGYTHQWENMKHKEYKRILMASCETPEQAERARAMGWRAFLIRKPGDSIPQGFMNCKKSEDIPQRDRMDCSRCKACNGASRQGKVSVSIQLHGSRPVFHNGLRVLAAIS